MAFVVTDEDGVNVSPGGYAPNPADIAASGFATITRSGGAPQKIVINGDSVEQHIADEEEDEIIHASSSMVSSMQSFFTINSVRAILVGDSSSCDPNHSVTSTIQQFVNVIPK